ncbi:MAG TPA: hypothetical protein DCR39_02475 [Nitrospiraceae bacterium]|nr:hypothetical protein [Nitrospiraceae bacterium]
MSLEGHLEDLSLADIFQIIHLSKKTGVLSVEHASGKGRIVFHNGQILYASLQNREKLGERLIKEGLIKEKELEAALRIQKDRKVHEPLGAILSENRLVEKDVLEGILREQLKEVVYELLSWEDGTFKFEADKDSPDILPGGSVSPEYLLLEGSRLKDEGTMVKEGAEEIKDLDEIIQPDVNIESGTSKTSVLLSLIEEISVTTESTEVLLMVLRLAGEILNRAVLFTVKEDRVHGFGQVGLSINSADQRVKGLNVPLSKPSVISNAVQKRLSYKGPVEELDWNNYLITHIGEGIPGEVFVSPVMEGDKVIAVLYGDNLPFKKPVGDTTILEAFIKVAGIVLLASKYINK